MFLVFQSAIQLQHVYIDGSKAYYNGACLKLEGVVQYANAMSRPAIARYNYCIILI